MGFLSEAVEMLAVVLEERGSGHATFARLVVLYRDVSDELGCRAAYESLLAGLDSETSATTLAA